MLTGEEIEEWPMPDWAKAKANEDYTFPNASLPTRDGRATGNAVVIGLSERQWENSDLTYKIVTDAGNILRLTESEMKQLFYPPEWVMKNLLITHLKALENEALGL